MMIFKSQKKSSSDASEYAWMHWTPGMRSTGTLTMLNSTPKRQRLLYTPPPPKVVVPKIRKPRTKKEHVVQG